MHKTFYASGFLYNRKAQQILLQQSKTAPAPQWSFFEKEGQINDEDPLHVFHEALTEQLQENIAIDVISPVYSYQDASSEKTVYIFYAEVDGKEPYHREGYNLEWFTVKQLSKLSLARQTKHDLIVADRVIKAKARMDTQQ